MSSGYVFQGCTKSKIKRKLKSSGTEIEIVGDENNSQKHTDVDNDTNHSKEQNLQGKDKEIVVKMEIADPTMIQGHCVTLNGEKFIIKQEDNVKGSYCLNKLDIDILNSPLNDKKDKEPSEFYKEQIFIKREIKDNNFSYISGEDQSNNANIDDSQRIYQCHGSEILIKKEIEDEDLIFSP
ncbi:unnamed protein product [Mytilus coruscus]|uniref:Uncharacterized protein n=1 Tax=Mytilus coruscus TaxID=42192 RepID=A0A6J8BQW5_MYTCO|nr:unnamed protein product [Mytilus coruscus]